MAHSTLPEVDAVPLAPPDDDTPPDCPRFEQTLLLIDGMLPAARLPEAKAHADDCAECGPLVRDWHAIGSALRACVQTESAAATAALEQRLQSAAREISAEPVAEPPFRARWREETTSTSSATHRPTRKSRWRRGWAAVAAAASSIAAACVLLMMRTDSLSSSMAPLTPIADAPDVQLQSVTFDDADGMLLQGEDGLTVIWITEHEET